MIVAAIGAAACFGFLVGHACGQRDERERLRREKLRKIIADSHTSAEWALKRTQENLRSLEEARAWAEKRLKKNWDSK